MANKINEKDLEAVFGVMIERGGLHDFLAFPKRKDSLKHSWPEENGQEIDLVDPKFEARSFRLKCILKATGATVQETKDNFWTLYNGLFTEISSLGTHQLYLDSIDKEFTVFYVDQQSVSKIGYEGKRMFIKFDLVFEETDPTTNIPKVYLTDESDNFLVA